jgi:hypothetical protein
MYASTFGCRVPDPNATECLFDRCWRISTSSRSRNLQKIKLVGLVIGNKVTIKHDHMSVLVDDNMNGGGARDIILSWATLTVQRYDRYSQSSISPSGTQGRADGCHHPSENGRKDKCEKKDGGLTDVVHPRTVLTSLRPLFLRLCLRSRGRLVAALSSPCRIPRYQAPRSPQTHVRICPDARRSPGRNKTRSVRHACPVHSFLAANFAPVRRLSVDAAVAAAAQ